MNGTIRPEDAAAFIMAINQIQPYVPPIVFNQLSNSALASQLAEIANRRVHVELIPVEIPNAAKMAS